MENDDNNIISVSIANALDYTKNQASKYPYTVPETENWNVWAEPSNRNFLRKAGSDFGWDWGPAFLATGISGDVELKQCKFGCINELIINQEVADDMKSAKIIVGLLLTSIPKSLTQSKYSVLLDGVVVLKDISVDLSNAQAHSDRSDGSDDSTMLTLGSFDIDRVKLWWPRGYGDAHLYEIEVRQTDNENENYEFMKKKIGVRTVELVQDPVGDSENLQLYQVSPTNFYFKVNGYPIFMKGANFIPIDSFQVRVTNADRKFVLDAAAAANMNMIRVWGGGIYQPDDFYNLADEMGIMIWQEIMLACALYPTSKNFLSEVRNEVKQQVARLHTHASIVVWGGNNENEVAIGWFTASQTNRDLYVSDYSKLYGETVYPAIKEIETSNLRAAWVDSSPSNGLISPDPYSKLWGSASTATAGDVHFYDYQCDCENPASFPQARFVSEFGFQVMPGFVTYEPVITKEDYNPNSELLLYRQRHENGNSQMNSQIKAHFTMPISCTPDSTNDQHYFDSYLFLSQIQQSRCYETAINLWRSLRSTFSAQTMGILYWQLNDIWQGPSWSSMEYGGRWKPLQYAVRRAYNDVAITSNTNLVTQTATFNVVNDLPYKITSKVIITLNSWTDKYSSTLYMMYIDFWPNQASEVWTISLADAISRSNGACSAQTCYIKAEIEVFPPIPALKTYPSFIFLSTMAEAKLASNPTFAVNNFVSKGNEIQFSLTSDVTAPFLFMELGNTQEEKDDLIASTTTTTKGVFNKYYAGWFSDNNFVAEAGVQYNLMYTFTSEESILSTQQFESLLKVRSLQKVYEC